MAKDTNTVESLSAHKVFDLPVTLHAGQVNTLAFAQDSIASMNMTAKGELEISFRDGSRLIIENFNELADSAKSCGRDTLIQLSDNTIIYPEELRDQLAQGPVAFGAGENGIITLDMPAPGQMVTQNIEAGHEYKMSFNLDGVNAAQSGNNLLLTFPNGGIITLANYYSAVGSDLPPVMTLADGATIDANALLTSCKLVSVPTVVETVAENQADPQTQIANIEPAAGEASDTAKAAHAEQTSMKVAKDNGFADIEPAAGDATGPLNATGGAGFSSSIDGAGFRGANAIGPIDPTALAYNAPSIPTIPYVTGTTGGDIDTVPTLDVVPSGDHDSLVDESGITTLTGNIVVDYKADGPGTLTLGDVSTFAYGGSAADGTLTSGGVPVVVTQVGNQFIGTAGGEIVFTLTLNDDGSYVFEQLQALDHADGTDPNDVITLEFGVVATDADGDSATGVITVHVLDDAPVATNDTISIDDANNVATGNITDNDTVGNDKPGYVVTAVTFDGTSYDVPVAGTVTVTGTYGTLVLGSDGAYTYTPFNTAEGTDNFTYTIRDFDGDTSSAAFNVTVADIDTKPTVEVIPGTLDETQIDETGGHTVTGNVTADFGDDAPGTLTLAGDTGFTASGSLTGGVLASNGVPVDVTQEGNLYIGKAGDTVVFTLILNDDGSYVFEQFAALDHADGTDPNDMITLEFGVIATDSDGDTADGKITINVIDDAPVAANDVATLETAPGTVSGNVVDNDDIGSDKPGVIVTSVTVGGVSYDVPATGTVTINGSFGNLTIGANGAYTYSGTSEGKDVFTYTIQDQDGDKATATLTVDVKDVDTVPCVENSCAALDETGVVPDGTESVSGHVNVNYFGDGPGTVSGSGAFTSGGSQTGGALTSNGVAVVVTLSGDTYTGKAGDTVVFTLKINSDGTYTYTQVDQLDHADGNNANDVINLSFGFVATDADGDSANGTITIKVADDAPVAVNDTATLASAPGSVNGNVTSNDNVGVDKPGYVVTAVVFNGTSYAVPATGTVTIAGAHGNLTIGANGAYTYSGTSEGKDVFTYTIQDQDGDKATATLTVDVKDVDTTPCITDSAKCIDETDLGPITVSGKVESNFFDDGPGTITGTGSVSVSGNAKGGALSSSGVPVIVTLVGDTYTGKAGDTTVFTLKVNTDGTYSFTQFDNLDHAIAGNNDETLNISFGVKATDSDGDTANAKITIKIDDDGPVAVNDGATVAKTQAHVTGDVTSNDDVGADFTANGVVAVKFGGTTYTVPATGTLSVVGTYGTLEISSNGHYTYTPKDGTTGGTDTFTYTLCDTDQDTATADLAIKVDSRYCEPPQPPCVESCDACVCEDGSVKLQVSAAPHGGNGNDVITLSISGFAAGWVVDTSHSGGTYNAGTGVWSITLAAGASFSGGPVVHPPANSDADLSSLTVKAVVYDPDSGLSASATDTMKVVVDAVADAPDLCTQDVLGMNGTHFDLNITTSLNDKDGSEVLKEIRIEGLPCDVTLSAGTYDAAHERWILTESQLEGLQIVTPKDYNDMFSLIVTSVSEEKNLAGEECTTNNNIAYSCDTVLVTIMNQQCGCDGETQEQTTDSVTSVFTSVAVSTTTSVEVSSSSSSTDSSDFAPIVIGGFDVDEGDTLDLSNLIDITDSVTASINDFVYATTTENSTIISVSTSSESTASVAVLTGVTNVSVTDIIDTTHQQQNQV